jgi:hypothetical protein
MYTNTIAVSLLAVAGALAAPLTSRTYDDTVTVALSDAGETGAQVTLKSTYENSAVPATPGPFVNIQITLGADVANKDLRCQALDFTKTPIVGLRGNNTDITFSDAQKGPWFFREPTFVTEVVCSPAFKKIDPKSDDLNLVIILENQSTETGSQTSLAFGVDAVSPPVGSNGPFETVELQVGKLLEKAAQTGYRCQILDDKMAPLVVLRAGKRDTTFSDADKGAWKLEIPSYVSEIVCKPSLVAHDLNAASATTTAPVAPATSSVL